jgi:hypothetical protein
VGRVGGAHELPLHNFWRTGGFTYALATIADRSGAALAEPIVLVRIEVFKA